MKHQTEILRQRVINMQAGTIAADRQISSLQNRIESIKPENFEELQEGIIEDLEEIKSFLNWVSNQ